MADFHEFPPVAIEIEQLSLPVDTIDLKWFAGFEITALSMALVSVMSGIHNQLIVAFEVAIFLGGIIPPAVNHLGELHDRAKK